MVAETSGALLIGTNGDIHTSPAIKRRKDTFYLLTGGKSFLPTRSVAAVPPAT
jgi:hypothetical protein